jgi:hypothetical protein
MVSERSEKNYELKNCSFLPVYFAFTHSDSKCTKNTHTISVITSVITYTHKNLASSDLPTCESKKSGDFLLQ